MYPNAYGANCESGSTQPYGMPNFGFLAKDPLLPQRCQDPTQMQVSKLIAYPFTYSRLLCTAHIEDELSSTPNLCESSVC